METIKKGNKIYVVKAPFGDCENYREPIIKVFLNKNEAEEFVEKENNKLNNNYCDLCIFKFKEGFKKIPKCCVYDEFGECKNDTSEEHQRFIEEYNVE